MVVTRRRRLPPSKELECPLCGANHPAFSCAGDEGEQLPPHGGVASVVRAEVKDGSRLSITPPSRQIKSRRPAGVKGYLKNMVMAATEINKDNIAEIIERVVMLGDLKQLKPEERVDYYSQVCRSLGLNPLTRPLEYITLNGKLTLYARKDCTEQLRKLHKVSIWKLETSEQDGIFQAMAYARSGDREDIDFGAASIKSLQGDALVNAKLKAITKAKRRVTLSICGLGFLDETEIETVPQATVPFEATPVVEDDPVPMITREQRKRLNDFIGGLKTKFGLTNEDLQTKMREVTAGVDKCNSLTEAQASEMIGIYAMWLNQLEESAAANAR